MTDTVTTTKQRCISDWIPHDGAKRPVPADAMVDVKWTTGEVFTYDRADFWIWSIPLDVPEDEGVPSGIIGWYRVVRPSKAITAAEEAER
ncbi:hypothetical protein [Ensifer sp. SL37]|uniref:hypothetical protein n=1 Tax=Ensifer sp. SL37 TaxID=2995137 RepID=UPI0022753F8C|nr:hypothetical protein [Ensifer sp. SL37]MCY1741184.1 hypothetical protein [Ensifer sp. SL37]